MANNFKIYQHKLIASSLLPKIPTSGLRMLSFA